MNNILPFAHYCRKFVWNVFHSLLNYFFNIYVKSQHNLNKNCYLYINKIGQRNRILINQIKYKETPLF